jgi:hypothetical protein
VWDHEVAAGEAAILYASIRKYCHVRSPEQIAHRVEKGFVPILKSLPGFKGYYLIDGGDELTTSRQPWRRSRRPRPGSRRTCPTSIKARHLR